MTPSRRGPPWAAVVTAAGLCAWVGVQYQQCVRLTGGRLVYALDDTYIHMALARTLAAHGTWGVNPGRFEPASSSPAWTLLLALLDRVFGPSDAAPLLTCLAAGCAVVFLLDRLLAPALRHAPSRAVCLGLVALLIPLPALVFSGMEAIPHVLLALALSFGAAEWMLGPRDAGVWRGAGFFVLAAVAVLTRFESLFLVGALALAALLQRRVLVAGVLVGGACVAVGAYAAWALACGGPWLPIPVLLDSHSPELASPATWAPFLRRLPVTLAERHHWHLPALLAGACGALLLNAGRVPESVRVPRLVLAVFVPTLLLHALFAGIGAFFRYEAYLVAIGLAGIVAVAAGGLASREDARAGGPLRAALVTLAALAVAAPLVVRGIVAVRNTPRAVTCIHRQQIQMSRFVHAYFRGQCVAINDLGAVSWYGGARVVDLAGLATPVVARARMTDTFTTALIDSLCASEGVRVALLYEAWFAGDRAVPPAWRAVARWTVPDPVVLGSPTVTIFSTSPGRADSLRAAVRTFGANLPADVRQEIVDPDGSAAVHRPAS